jgi:hypothetical protein
MLSTGLVRVACMVACQVSEALNYKNSRRDRRVVTHLSPLATSLQRAGPRPFAASIRILPT